MVQMFTSQNGTKIHKLKEYSVPLAPGYSFYYYSIDSSNLSTAFTGKLNTAYSLQVKWQGQQYNASTSIPNITRKIDTLWWMRTTDSNKVTVVVRATDPPGFGDYIRYYTKRNREPFFPGYNSVYDDLFIDGTTYELQVEPGFDRNNPVGMDERLFNRGDTVTLKVSNIDKGTFDFWRTSGIRLPICW